MDSNEYLQPGAPRPPGNYRTSRVAAVAGEQGRRVATEMADQAQEAASTVADETRQVAGAATSHARAVAGATRDEVSQVANEVTSQAKALAEEAGDRLEAKAEYGARRAARGVDQLAAEAVALAQGRPEEAPNLVEYVWQAAEKLCTASDGLHGLADTLDQRGWEGLATDIQSIARRRPATFLLGATIAGLGVGRTVRNASGQEPQSPPSRPGSRFVGTGSSNPSLGKAGR